MIVVKSVIAALACVALIAGILARWNDSNRSWPLKLIGGCVIVLACILI